MLTIPSEVQLFGLYLPPLLLICLLGLLIAMAISQVLNWVGMSRIFWHPPLAFVAMWVLSSALIGILFMSP